MRSLGNYPVNYIINKKHHCDKAFQPNNQYFLFIIGWELNTFGYHGDDGKKFRSFYTGRDYGPPFTAGDTIGCGINFYNRTAFYTKNGICLGNIVSDAYKSN